MKEKAVLLVLFTLFYILGKTQYSNLIFEQLTNSDGLPNRLICMYKDHKGYLWFGGTDGIGLYKYNGYRTIEYRLNKNQLNSLSNDNIYSIYEDSKNNLWICTGDGLNLFNRETETFKVFRNDSLDKKSISSNAPWDLLEDKKGNLWIITDKGLNKWNPTQNYFDRYLINQKNIRSLENNILSIKQDSKGNIWVITHGRGIYQFEPGTGKFILYDDPAINFGYNLDKRSCIDNNDIIWVTISGVGLINYNPSTNRFKQFNTKGDGKGTNGNLTKALIQEDARHMLITVDQGGISRYDMVTQTFEYITYNEKNKEGLNNNGIWDIYQDNEGIIWLLTSGGGINYYNPKKNKFKLFRHNYYDSNSLSYDVVGYFYEDLNGFIWIGTDGGGLDLYNPQTNRFKTFKNNPSDPYSISGNAIRCMAEDENKDLWIGTWDKGFNRFDRNSGKFHTYLPDAKKPTSISGKTVWHFCIDHKGIFWLAVHDIGIDLFDKKKGVIKRFRPDSNNSKALSSSKVWYIYEDSNQNIWICTDNGLNRYDSIHDNFIVYKSFPSNSVKVIAEDKEKNLWIGTTKGICLIKANGTKVYTYDEKSGLSGNQVNGIVCDKRGNLWISTNNGISKFDPKTKIFRNFMENEGLQNNSFFPGSFLITRNNEIYFGGFKGFNSFFPDSFKVNNTIPPVYIDEFQIFNKPVAIGTSGSPLKKAITETKEISLTHLQSVFSFGFSDINYTYPEKNQYAYKMEGFEEEWNYTNSSRRYATYTNLDPGKYTFRVKASNNDGIWNEKGSSLIINILPPWWKTWWFKTTFYICLIGLILLFSYIRTLFYRHQKKKLQVLVKERTLQLETVATSLEETQEELNSQNEELMAQKDELEKANIEIDMHRNQLESLVEERTKELVRAKNKAEESDRLKSSFLANMSHEIRTPLNAILGFTSLLCDNTTTDTERSEFHLIIQNNSAVLLDLINDILDISIIESNQMKLELGPVQLENVIYDLVEVFNMMIKRSDLIAERSVTLKVNIQKEIFYMQVISDKRRLEQVLSNLISNALKFTNKGYIEIGCSRRTENKTFEFYVKDTGIGIKEENLQLIFERFRKIEENNMQLYRGTGLGLTISSQLVKLLGGTMWVTSKVGEGSVFYFTIPEVDFREAITSPILNKEMTDDLPDLTNRTILVAEDDFSNFLFIERLLKKTHVCVIHAENGNQVLKMIQNHPEIELVLMDIKMPEMDGIEALHEIRKMNIQIPVIAQTAYTLAGEVIKLKAEGFNEYISKPINSSVLYRVIHQNLIKI
jgi:signal transduction histidine kinase/ligand-binding sensor domain-containing protein/CheY-like chemotaxis protein